MDEFQERRLDGHTEEIVKALASLTRGECKIVVTKEFVFDNVVGGTPTVIGERTTYHMERKE